MNFSSKEVGTGTRYLVNKIFWIVQSLLFIGAGAGAGEKNTRSRSKTDRFRNTGCIFKLCKKIPDEEFAVIDPLQHRQLGFYFHF